LDCDVIGVSANSILEALMDRLFDFASIEWDERRCHVDSSGVRARRLSIKSFSA
jgi:hypothetical protein